MTVKKLLRVFREYTTMIRFFCICTTGMNFDEVNEQGLEECS